MGCLTVTSMRIGGMSVEARPNDTMTVTATVLGGITVGINSLGHLVASAENIGGMVASASLFCDIVKGVFLRVTPTETQWVTEWESAAYDVRSNVNWIVEQNSF